MGLGGKVGIYKISLSMLALCTMLACTRQVLQAGLTRHRRSMEMQLSEDTLSEFVNLVANEISSVDKVERRG